MKTSLSILLFLPAIASAQRGEPTRGDRPRVEGLYESMQRDNSIRRTLRLERDGTAEVVTEAKNSNRDRRSWGRDDTKRFGKIATAAMQDRTVHHLGRWRWLDDQVFVVFDDLRLGADRWKNVEMKLRVDNGTLTFDRNSDVYGENKIVFRRDGGWDGGRPQTGPRLGYLRYDKESLTIEDVAVRYGKRDNGRLTIRAGGRTIELEGETFRDGDDTVFRLPDGAGEYRLTFRDGRIVKVMGRGDSNRHRVEFADRPGF